MHIAVYSPYLDTAGGGEKYMLTIAETLSPHAQVDVLLDPHLQELGIENIKKRCETFHDLNLHRVNFVAAPMGIGGSFISRLFFLRRYDVIFFMTDGSFFLSTAKKSVIHFQMPLENVAARGIWGRVKLGSWSKAIYNSNFTKSYIERNWPIRGEVVYPPVSVGLFKPIKKKKQIITVGRFAANTKVKKHSLMIRVFKELVDDKSLKDWRLVLVGGLTEGDNSYFEQLKEEAKGYNIGFYPNASLAEMIKYYGESSIYWHAMGFEEDDPKRFEHFGITTVEAMAAGCVPIVINKGGQPEIVKDGISGYLWNTVEELKRSTLKVVQKKELLARLSKCAQLRSVSFSKDIFNQKIMNLVFNN